MAKLYTFGCSFTYGHGLEDCFNEETNGPGPDPSKFAWPKLLGNRTGLVVENHGECGAGNATILSKIMETHTSFSADDTVVILWSFQSRYCYFTKDQHRYVTTQVTPSGVKSWSRKKGVVNQTETAARFNEYHAFFSSAFNDRVRTLLIANTACQYLKSKVKNVLQYSLEPIDTDYFTKELLQYPIEGLWSDCVTSSGTALDGAHPDAGCHNQFADAVYNKWKQYD